MGGISAAARAVQDFPTTAMGEATLPLHSAEWWQTQNGDEPVVDSMLVLWDEVLVPLSGVGVHGFCWFIMFVLTVDTVQLLGGGNTDTSQIDVFAVGYLALWYQFGCAKGAVFVAPVHAANAVAVLKHSGIAQCLTVAVRPVVVPLLVLCVCWWWDM